MPSLDPFFVPLKNAPQEIQDAVKESGMGLILDWVPQQEVLQHPSVGAFITHGGANSTLETIATGVLPVFWPFSGDQPFHAAYVTQIVSDFWPNPTNLLADASSSTQRDAGFELIQVRSQRLAMG